MSDNPDENLLILQLSGDSKRIARLISNETSIKILKLLDKRSMSQETLQMSLKCV
jgi:ArsR family transcriptional regulator, arsenate/arsenite/antimonite-responsive transcriptional repressor